MERSAPYALIGLFVLLGLAIGAGLLVWLTDYDPGRRDARYAVVFEDVSGLSLASEVRYNGLPVGEVASMALDPAGTGLIRVEIDVLEEVPLRRGAVARLSAQGVTGVAVVALEGGDPSAPALPESPAGVPMLAAGRGAVETLADEGPALLAEARTLVADLRAFATPENAERIARVLAELERGAAGLGEVGALAEDLGGIGRELAPALRGLPGTLARVEAAAGEAEALAAALRGVAEDRLPDLADDASAAIGSLSGALKGTVDAFRDRSVPLADAAQARLDEAGPVLEAVASATASLDGAARPIDAALSDVAPAAASLRDSLPPLIADARGASTAIRSAAEEARDRLPELALQTEAALARTRGVEPALAAVASASRSVEAAAAGINVLAGDLAPAAAEIGSAGARIAESAASVAKEAGPLLEAASALTGEARAAVRGASDTVAQANGALERLGRSAPALDRALRQVSEAAEAVRRLARHLERNPSSLLLGR